MTLQAKKLVPDFTPPSNVVVRRVPVPAPPRANAEVAPTERAEPQPERVLEAPAGMWGY